jgi:hypothetical protein
MPAYLPAARLPARPPTHPSMYPFMFVPLLSCRPASCAQPRSRAAHAATALPRSKLPLRPLLCSCSYAAYSATAMGIATYGPMFLLGLQYFTDETKVGR